jgi:hypothetical protein
MVRKQPIEDLNGRLLIDAEHRGMLRRIQLQAEYLGSLGFERGIVRARVPHSRRGCNPARRHTRAIIE